MWKRGLFLRFQFLLASPRTTVINNNIDNQEAQAPSIRFCQLIKMYNLGEIKGFFPKVATSGPNLTFLWT